MTTSHTATASPCVRHKWSAVPNSDFVRERHIYHAGTVHVSAHHNVKCERCGLVKARAGGSALTRLVGEAPQSDDQTAR